MVVAELGPGPVRAGARRHLVESAVLEPGQPGGRVQVLDQVALAVVAVPLGRAVRERREASWPSSVQARRVTAPSGPVIAVTRPNLSRSYRVDRPVRAGDRNWQARRVTLHPGRGAERIGDAGQVPAVVVGVAR